ncbi:uncharacterized protein LOC120356847 isoform X5 [Solenopsis invicta]|uniref:uncharacterized protein LOC120356847 isoform X5 n=1 Tax=Solenopsis invicta TaxID=13686 RepID=UPI00193DF5AC|nr:uncharacterized protein LOC120356847 isoform X5 [Solenopsis invicta]
MCFHVLRYLRDLLSHLCLMVLFRLDAKDLYYIICAYIYTLFLVGCEGLISYTLTFIDSSIFCYTESTIFKIFYHICASWYCFDWMRKTCIISSALTFILYFWLDAKDLYLIRSHLLTLLFSVIRKEQSLRMEYYVLLYDMYCISVPSSWINFDQSTFKIPKKHTEVSKACHKQLTPLDNWHELSFKKKFGPFDTYSNARAVEKTVSELSTSNDENIFVSTTVDKEKRLIRKRKFYGDTSTDEDEQGRKREKNKGNINAPSNYVPQKKEKHISYSQPIEKSVSSIEPEYGSEKMRKHASILYDKCNDSLDDLEKDSELSHSSHEHFDEEDVPENTDEMKNTDTHKNYMKSQEIRKDRKEGPLQKIQLSIPEKPNNTGIKFYEAKKKTQQDACRLKFLQVNAKINHKLNRIINLLENKGGDKADPVEQNNNNLLPDFPLTTIQELNNFNEQLMQNDVQRQFVKKMSKIGGDTVSKTVRNVMSQTITDELAQIYTWTGQKNRLALKKTKISDVIIEAIMISINTTMAEVEGYMKEWVRRASDRIRSLSKK